MQTPFLYKEFQYKPATRQHPAVRRRVFTRGQGTHGTPWTNMGCQDGMRTVPTPPCWSHKAGGTPSHISNGPLISVASDAGRVIFQQTQQSASERSDDTQTLIHHCVPSPLPTHNQRELVSINHLDPRHALAPPPCRSQHRPSAHGPPKSQPVANSVF